MAKEEAKVPSRITPVGIGKATLTFLIDFFIAAALAGILYLTIGQNVILAHNDYYPALAAEEAFVLDTGLAQKTESGGYTLYVFKDEGTDYAYKKYVEKVWNYFTVVLPGSDAYVTTFEMKNSSDGTSIPAFNGLVSKENNEYLQWVYRYFFGYVEGSADNVYGPSEPGNLASIPAPQGIYKEESVYYAKLSNDMYDTERSRGHYIDAVEQLNSQPMFSAIGDRISLSRYAAMAPAFGIPAIVFFFIVPLCIPNGKTLGKLFLGEAVIGFDGYTAPKISIVLRQGIITTIFLLLALPWQVVCWPLFALLSLILYMSRVLSKRSQPLHDRLARTVAIEAKKSIWFASKEQEETFLTEHPMSPYAKQVRAAEAEASMETAVSSAIIEAQESILDLSTINKRREEARRMTSFDEFERQSDAEFAAREEEAKQRQEQGKEPIDPKQEEQDMRDAALLEGLTPEEAAELAEKEDVEDPDDGDPDAFTDDSGDTDKE
ncbi:MAG: RDD family protein [Bacilli bacterium]|nr:RDD family protein [Bacilli bacterium]